MSTATYQIYPLHLGDIIGQELSLFTYNCNQGVKINNPFLAFLIRGNGKNILVDTGPSDEAWAKQYHMPITVPQGADILSALRRHGVEPGDLDYIINTHLHWDHCFNNHLFPGKKIYLQEKELYNAINPLDIHRFTYESPQSGIIANWLKTSNQFVLVNGDTVIDDGIELIFLPGHTDGTQGVLVNTTAGEYFLAGDCINIAQNWEGNGKLKHIIGGIHTDLKAYYATYEKLEFLEKTRRIKIIPGHDPLVLNHAVYPD